MSRRVLIGASATGAVVLLALVGWWFFHSPIKDRDDWQKELWGLGPQEVRAKLGSPDRADTPTTYDPATLQDALWTYWKRSRDPRTGKVDGAMHVFFRQGRVGDVHFDP